MAENAPLACAYRIGLMSQPMSAPEPTHPTAQPRFGVVGENFNPEVAPSTQPKGPQDTIVLIGIGAGGFEELGLKAQTALRNAEVILGSWRQLNMLPESLHAERHPWPAPQHPDLESLFKGFNGRHVAVLASGDPLFFGAGPALVKALGMQRLEIIPAPSSASLACARLGWPLERTLIASLATDPVETLIPFIDSGARFLVLGKDEFSAPAIAELLNARGQGTMRITVLSDLGSSDEEISIGTAAQPPAPVSALNVIAIEPAPDAPKHKRSLVPGADYGEVDKEATLLDPDLRAMTIAALKPIPGDTLWSVGEPTGTIAIEWLRVLGLSTSGGTRTRARAICFEATADRAAQISRTATAAGVPWLKVVHATPLNAKALKDIRYNTGPDAASPDAIYLGKAILNELITETAWMVLKPGGTMVASAVNKEEIAKLEEFHAHYGGVLKSFTMGSSHTAETLSVTQWRATKPLSPSSI